LIYVLQFVIKIFTLIELLYFFHPSKMLHLIQLHLYISRRLSREYLCDCEIWYFVTHFYIDVWMLKDWEMSCFVIFAKDRLYTRSVLMWSGLRRDLLFKEMPHSHLSFNFVTANTKICMKQSLTLQNSENVLGILSLFHLWQYSLGCRLIKI